MANNLEWLIILLPFLSFAVISLILRPFFPGNVKISGYSAIASIGGALLLSLYALSEVISSPHHEIITQPLNWLVIDGQINLQLQTVLDPLTVIMLVVVTIISLMVQIYSQGYMKGDPGYHRYFAYMSLFTASMLGLVLVDNLFMMFVFWELVGLCSYLLIGFWVNKPSAANAAKKAFIVTRIGDVGFLAAILLLFSETGTLSVAEVSNYAAMGLIGGTALTFICVGIFMGAVGKSAQFPLHIWLPDAMEGPTPVSALIHAATMVAAGVFLVARMFPLFEVSESALMMVAIIGAVTCIFAASMGLVMTDIKRVLAYSTISQLGYMMLGLGTGGIAVGLFHLFNHAFFKALLFLGSGSVNHATGTFEMDKMGGLKKIMPYTYITFLIASLSMAGVWPLSGFWSKDEILASSLEYSPLLFTLALITVFLTSFYIFRVIFMTFSGTYKGEGKPHESSKVMVLPMLLLCGFAIFSGFANIGGGFDNLFGHGEERGFFEGLFDIFSHPLALISLAISLSGIFFAYAVYQAKWFSAERIRNAFRPLHTLFSRKYFMDEFFEDLLARKLFLNGTFNGLSFIDSRIIDGGFNTLLIENAIVRKLFSGFKTMDDKGVDGAVNYVADGTRESGNVLRRAQTGQLQMYGAFMVTGIITIILFVYFTS